MYSKNMINILFFFLCLVASIIGHQSDGIVDDLEIEKELKLLNKSPVKSIHTKFGYIVDCIDINKQPAFDHPLLMNHKLQRKPSFQNEIQKANVKNSSTKVIFGLKRGQCPTGTVPIKRTTKEDLIRGKSFFNNLKFENYPRNHAAHVTLRTVNPIWFSYFGVSGSSSVYNVKVEEDQSSSSIMWVRNGAIDNTNFIGIGWHVASKLYGDDETHLYVLWTSDNFKSTGCYNLLCSGFVQTSKSNYLGGRFTKTSIYGGQMVEITVSIIQDPRTKDWWVTSENENLGYFPAALFSNLTSADQVGWGGRTSTSVGSPSPPMGSGYKPDGIFNHASYFRFMTYQNNSRKNYPPEEWLTDRFTDKPDCFDATFYGNRGREIGDAAMLFGGPGGNCGD